MKTFDITLSIDCRINIQIEAANEQAAREKAASKVRHGEFTLEDHIREISVDDIEALEDDATLIFEDGSDDEFIKMHAAVMDELLAEEAAAVSVSSV